MIRTLSTVQNGPSFAQIREDPSKIRQFQFCTFFRLCARSPAKLQFLTTASLSCPFLRSFSPSAATRTPCPAFHPLSTDFTFSGRFTLPSASPQVSARLTLRLPPGGFTLQAPAECVLSAHESQLLLRLADSMDDVILSSLAQARTDLHVNPADHTAEDAVFTDNDQAGNVIVGFSTDPAVAIILTRLRFRLYPEGVDVPASSYGVTPRLRAALNSLPSRPAQGQFAFDASTFTAATFPAVDVVVAQYHALTGAAVGQPAADPPALRIVDISGDADAGDAGVAAAGRFFSSAIPTRALDGCQSELIPVFAPPDFCSRRASVSFPVLLPSAYAVCHRSAPNASCLRPSSIQRTPLPPWSSRFSHRLLSALVHFRCVLPRFPRSLAVLFDNHPQQPPDCPSARSTHPPFPPPFTPRPSFALPSPRPSHSATSILAIDSSSTDGSMPASEFTSPHVLIPRFPLSAAWHSTLEHRPTHSTCTALSDVSALSDVLDSPFASSPAPHLVSIFVASRPALPFIVRLPPFHTVDAAPSTFDMHLFASSITLGIAVFHWLPSFISMICSAYHLWRRASCLLSRQHSRSAARSYTRRFTAHTACQTRRLFASYFTFYLLCCRLQYAALNSFPHDTPYWHVPNQALRCKRYPQSTRATRRLIVACQTHLFDVFHRLTNQRHEYILSYIYLPLIFDPSVWPHTDAFASTTWTPLISYIAAHAVLTASISFIVPFASGSVSLCHLLQTSIVRIPFCHIHLIYHSTLRRFRLAHSLLRPFSYALPCMYLVRSSQPCRQLSVLLLSMFSCLALLNLSLLLLLLGGDIHPHPGPPPGPSHTTALPPTISDHLNVLNWNCRGIDAKLASIPSFLRQHDIHVAIFTDTRRSLGVHKSNNEVRSGGYTFYFSSHIDTSHSVCYLPSRTREWGVCIAVRTGLAYQSTSADVSQFRARLQHGTLSIPTPNGTLVQIDIIGAYAPAQPEQKTAFWEAFTSYVLPLAPLADTSLGSSNRHTILAGDWNSYLDLERDIYRADPPDSTERTTPAAPQHLLRFLTKLADQGFHLYDPMARDKLTAYHDFTYSSSKQTYRSILDKVFTSFPPDHCEPTQVLDSSVTQPLGLSDHRPVLHNISLARLCHGWLEYPDAPLTRPRIDIDTAHLSADQELTVRKAVVDWQRTLPPSLAPALLHDPIEPPPHISSDALAALHEQLTTLFVTIPATAFHTGSHTPGHRLYKTVTAGKTQRALHWLKRYRLLLTNLHAAKIRGAQNIDKPTRREARRLRTEYFTDTTLHNALQPSLPALFSTKLATWTLRELNTHSQTVDTLHKEFKKVLDHDLFTSKQDRKRQARDAAYSTPIGSTARRRYQLGHRTNNRPLPSIMKHPANPSILLTGSDVNETWGSSATATRPNTMPTVSTEPSTPPWLNPGLWTTVQHSIAPAAVNLMAPITATEIRTFLNHTGKSAPGLDGIQYDVLRYMCLQSSLSDLLLISVLQRFLNILLRQQEFPTSMKTALLTFIHKSGDPLQFGNYRGISLLSCLFKLITGILNGRLQNILHDYAGLDFNQGANRKGIHAAHKAAVVMNIIADAKLHKRPLHIIYTDIKGAFPSVPYQAFTDALTVMGLDNSLLRLIINMQTDFTCVAKGPTGYSSPKPKVNGVHEGDCLSPTLFCLVLNMYFHWLRSTELGYDMTSATGASPPLYIQTPVNGYADDMALIGRSHDEAQQLLDMLTRFLSYYGMELNPLKCAYQYRTEDPTYRPPLAFCRWGNIPTFYGRTSYKYLGYYVNMHLDFKYQFDVMARKLEEACLSYYGKTAISIKEAVSYVNSDLISKLRYRMYLIKFPLKYLNKFQVSCNKVVKRLAHLASSTSTDLLISQGLLNISNLQNIVRAEFLQNCLQAVDQPCRITSQISYTHLKYTTLHGLSPFSTTGLQTADWNESHFSPLFMGVRDHLITINMALQIHFDTKINLASRNINDTIGPLAYQYLRELADADISSLIITRLFQNLTAANLTTLDDLSPLFDAPLSPTAPSPWIHLISRPPRSPADIFTRYASSRILHPGFHCDNVSIRQRKLLRILLHLFLERLLRANATTANFDSTESATHWGGLRKHSLPATLAYPDGSATKDNTRAGFGIYFPEFPNRSLVSRIPGHQTIARAEAYGVLTSLLVASLNTNLLIYCDRQSLVNQINRFIDNPPREFEIRNIADRSLLLRILEIIRRRSGSTLVLHVKAHERDHCSTSELSSEYLSELACHQERNKAADKLAKSSLSLSLNSSLVPLETRFLSAVNVLLPPPLAAALDAGVLFENNPIKLYTHAYSSDRTLHYFGRGEWHQVLFSATIWQAPSTSIIFAKGDSTDKKRLIQILGRTLPTFHRLRTIRPRLYPDELCILCDSHPSETIEHLFYECPTFAPHRQQLLTRLVSICRSRALLHTTTAALRAYLLDTLLQIPSEHQRFFSAGQLPHSLFVWLSSRLPTLSQTTRLGKELHAALLDFFQHVWRDRCALIKERHHLFKDRLHAFPHMKPLHDMDDTDYVAFANRWRELNPAPGHGTSHDSTPRPTTTPLSNTILQNTLAVPSLPPSLSNDNLSGYRLQSSLPRSHTPPISPTFPTTHHIFAGRLTRCLVQGDGNCLFRAILLAHGQQDTAHHTLRLACVQSITADWETYTHQINAVHQDTPAFSSDTNEPFPTPAHYSNYMSIPGNWATEVEAFACARHLQAPLLIWSSVTGLPLHPLFNFSSSAPPFTQRIMHIAYNGTDHYEALIVPIAATAALLSHQVYNDFKNPNTPPSSSSAFDATHVFQRSSRSQLHFGTTGHQTKRRRIDSPTI